MAEARATTIVAPPAPVQQSRTLSVVEDMAVRFGMDKRAFEMTIRKTCMPEATSNEELAAFLLVARDYTLNPILREIFAFPKKGGGIQPIVSVDGWITMINRHPQFNGMDFQDNLNDDGSVRSITCMIYRKDRDKPVTITEYMSECVRQTDPWKQWPVRMLRHKALIQCARIAFGFSGLQDPDEYDRMISVTAESGEPAPPRPTRAEMVEVHEESQRRPEPTAESESVEDPENPRHLTSQAFITMLASATTTEALKELWSTLTPEQKDNPSFWEPFEDRKAALAD